MEVVTANYFETLRVQLAAGRAFTPGRGTPRLEDPGRHRPPRSRRSARPDDSGECHGLHRRGRQPLEIVGVAAPIRDKLFDREAGPAIYVPYGRNYRSMTSIHGRAARSGTEGDVLAAIRRELRAMDPRPPSSGCTG